MRVESVEMGGCVFGFEDYCLTSIKHTPRHMKVQFMSDNTVLKERVIGDGARRTQIPFGTEKIAVSVADSYAGPYVEAGSIKIHPPEMHHDAPPRRRVYSEISVIEELAAK